MTKLCGYCNKAMEDARPYQRFCNDGCYGSRKNELLHKKKDKWVSTKRKKAVFK